MLNNGWVKLHRKSLENPVICKDSDYFSVWCYLLLHATHDKVLRDFNGELLMLDPGQLITGRKTMSKKFNISESKVQRILKRLESEHQIKQRTTNTSRLITILNWGQYQQTEHQSEQPVNNQRTTSEQPVNTYKNVKNVKNVKNAYINNSNKNNNINNKDIYNMNTPQKYFYDKYYEKFNEKYIAEFGKDGKIFKELSKILSEDVITDKIDMFIDSRDDFIVMAGYTVGVFKSQINKLRAKSIKTISNKTINTLRNAEDFLNDE